MEEKLPTNQEQPAVDVPEKVEVEKTEIEPTENTEVEFEDDLSEQDELKTQNRKWYELRKQKEREREEKIAKLAQEKALEALKGIENPYTKETIETFDDVQEFKRMQELEKKGLDPLNDYHKAVKEERKKELEVQEANSKVEMEKERIRKENDSAIKEYSEKYKVDIEKMYRTDPEFKTAMSDYLKDGLPLKTALRTYFTMQDRIQTAAEKRAKDLELKSQATPGGLSGVEPSSDYYSEEELDRMSVKELKANWTKVNRSMEIIRKKKGW